MRAKDASEKILEAYNDVFADIVNVLLFGGEHLIGEDDLEEQAPRGHYKADGKLRELERDVVKRWKDNNIRIACIGLENQTESDPDMPLRVIGYDGAEYRAQLLRDDKRKADGHDDDAAIAEARTPRVRYPVVSLVLYYGYERRWSGKKTLKERLTIPPRLDPYVNDYRINLFEIAYLDRELAALFQSDYRIVVDYFIQKRESGDYVPSVQEFVHVQETLQLISIMSKDKRFEEACRNAGVDADGRILERRPRNMCEVLDRIENRGIQKGIERGEDRLALLMSQLFAQNRMNDAMRASEDREYREDLMREFGIK